MGSKKLPSWRKIALIAALAMTWNPQMAHSDAPLSAEEEMLIKAVLLEDAAPNRDRIFGLADVGAERSDIISAAGRLRSVGRLALDDSDEDLLHRFVQKVIHHRNNQQILGLAAGGRPGQMTHLQTLAVRIDPALAQAPTPPAAPAPAAATAPVVAPAPDPAAPASQPPVAPVVAQAPAQPPTGASSAAQAAAGGAAVAGQPAAPPVAVVPPADPAAAPAAADQAPATAEADAAAAAAAARAARQRRDINEILQAIRRNITLPEGITGAGVDLVISNTLDLLPENLQVCGGVIARVMNARTRLGRAIQIPHLQNCRDLILAHRATVEALIRDTYARVQAQRAAAPAATAANGVPSVCKEYQAKPGWLIEDDSMRVGPGMNAHQRDVGCQHVARWRRSFHSNGCEAHATNDAVREARNNSYFLSCECDRHIRREPAGGSEAHPIVGAIYGAPPVPRGCDVVRHPSWRTIGAAPSETTAPAAAGARP